MNKKIIAFDFDETLSQKNTLLPYFLSVSGSSIYGCYLLAGCGAGGLFDYVRGLRNTSNPSLSIQEGFSKKIKTEIKDCIRNRVLSHLKTISSIDIDSCAADHLHGKIAYNQNVVSKLHEYKAKGYEVWIATGSSQFFVDRIARNNGWPIDKVIGTKVSSSAPAFDVECIRQNKKTRILNELSGNKLSVSFGNFPDDSNMFDLSDVAYNVCHGRCFKYTSLHNL